MSSFGALTRKPVRQFQPYVPGKPIEEIKARFGLDRVIKLASNENPLGPSPRALSALANGLSEIHRYPEGGSTRLRHAIARRYGVDPACVLAGSGSDEIIELLAKTFLERGDGLVASEHAFIRYKMAGQLMDAAVVETPMDGFRHDLVAMRRAVTSTTKLICIANPNNPTGTYVTRAEVDQLLAGVPADRLVVLDEAYWEYAREIPDFPDGVELLRTGRRNVVTLRTFSKAYGLAGLRTGYAIADPDVIAQIDRIRPPFNLTIPAQIACEAALDDADHVEKSVRLNREVRGWLCGELAKRGVDHVPSAGNFVLVRARNGGVRTFEDLLRKGVIVRPMAEYGFPEHVRVSIGTREEMETFLREFLALGSA